jgi:hypothetical protein
MHSGGNAAVNACWRQCRCESMLAAMPLRMHAVNYNAWHCCWNPGRILKRQLNYMQYIYIYIYIYEREIMAAVPLNSGGNAAAATPLHPCMDNVAELS